VTHIAVHGLGYVGTVTAACLATNGYRVTGVDVKPAKVESIEKGRSPVEEPGLADLVERGVDAGRLSATTDTTAAMCDAEISIVCVGTPVAEDGTVKLDSVRSVARGLGEGLAGDGGEYHTVVLRSTVPPGTTKAVSEIVAEESGRTLGEGFGVVVNPEFMREGSAIDDFQDPPFVVLGSRQDRSIDVLLEIYETLGVTPAQIFPVEPAAAEILKYACNAFHAAKVAFANEIGRVCRENGIDGRTVMEVFLQDRKLNISETYLTPGFAFGGSCLHKDTRAITGFADDELPLLESILPSNERHARAAFDRIVAADPEVVGIAGLSFKAGTDDMRNSPSVLVTRCLIDADYDVVAYDPNVDAAELLGSNRAFVESVLPELEEVLVDSLDALAERADSVLVGNADDAYEPLVDTDVTICDPVGLFRKEELPQDRYDSVCW